MIVPLGLVGLAAPHLAASAQDVPDLVHAAVGHRPGDLARAEFEVRHPAAGELERAGGQVTVQRIARPNERRAAEGSCVRGPDVRNRNSW